MSFWQIWFFSLICKWVIAACLPLGGDEVYYWVWSQNLQWSYFDHPPMVSWILFLGGAGVQHLGSLIRWPIVLMGHLTLVVWQSLFSDYVPPDRLKWWIILGLFSPLIGWGSLVATPDVPLVFFWSLSAFFLWRIERSGEEAKGRSHLWNYFFLGATLGLGFLSKYQIVLFPLCGLFFILWNRSWRNISGLGVLVTILTGLFFCLPVLYWNYLNQFSSFRFQVNHGLGGAVWEPKWTGRYLLGQVLAPFPVLFFYALGRTWSLGKGSQERSSRGFSFGLFLSCLAWVPLGFFALSSFRGAVEWNWPVMALPAILGLVLGSRIPKYWLRIASVFGAGVGISLVLIISCLQFFPGILPKWMVPSRIRELDRYEVGERVSKIYEPLYLDSYQMASAVWFRTHRPHYKLRGMSRYDFFDDIPGSLPDFSLQKEVFILKHEETSWPSWVDSRGCVKEKIESVGGGYEVYRLVAPRSSGSGVSKL